MILQFRVNTYARNVYLYGNTKLTDIPTSPDNYRTATMQTAANEASKGTAGVIQKADIYTALENGWITQQEYDDTIALIST